jgi:isopropylmalate/homocitrate/citramalate synthase
VCRGVSLSRTHFAVAGGQGTYSIMFFNTPNECTKNFLVAENRELTTTVLVLFFFDKVLDYMMTHLNCHEISLGDTIGVATPASTIAMLEAAQAVVGSSSSSSSSIGSSTRTKLAVHFHDTYGQALANILVSLERGIDTIDSSVAGLGGCPYAHGASGNVATEDVLYMLKGLGVETGIDLDKVVDAAEFITGVLGRPSRSRAGLAISARRQRNSNHDTAAVT